MTITICSSTKFYQQINDINERLRDLGHMVFTPELSEPIVDYTLYTPEVQAGMKQHFIDRHLAKIKHSDAIFVLNNQKGDLANYIGPNVLLEMAFAYALDKKIYLYHDIPTQQSNEVEIRGLRPVCLRGDINQLI